MPCSRQERVAEVPDVWCVCGISRCPSHVILFSENADIYCFNEMKSTEAQFEAPDGYQMIFNECTDKKGFDIPCCCDPDFARLFCVDTQAHVFWLEWIQWVTPWGSEVWMAKVVRSFLNSRNSSWSTRTFQILDRIWNSKIVDWNGTKQWKRNLLNWKFVKRKSCLVGLWRFIRLGEQTDHLDRGFECRHWRLGCLWWRDE